MKQIQDVIWQMLPHELKNGQVMQHSPVANIIVNSGAWVASVLSVKETGATFLD